MSGAPSVERDLALSHAGYLFFTYAGPLVVASGLEGAIALLSDRWDRRRAVPLAQWALAAVLAGAACARNAWVLGLCLALAGAASGVACGSAQALLVAGDPRGPDRAMVRWTVFSAIGDLLAPLVTAAAVAVGCSYRGALLGVAVVVALQAATSRRLARANPMAPAQHVEDAEPPTPPLAPSLAEAARNGRLWVWLFAAATCTLLDEIVVALGVLRLSREQAVGDAVAAAAAVLFAAGSIAGSLVADRLVDRTGARPVLAGSGVLAAAALGVAVGAHAPLSSLVALFVLGAASAPHHPLAFAQAYRAMPGRPGVVQACAQVFVVVDVVAPILVGAVADRGGLDAALACLLVQPVAVTLLAWALWPCDTSSHPGP